MFCCEKTQWFAMRVTYRRELDVKNLDQQGVSSFIPMHYVIRMAKKRKVRELVPVVHNLIFIHITQTDMKELKKDIPYLQYMTDSRSGEKIIVPDGQMRDFIAVAGTYDEHLLFFKPEEINPANEGIFIKVKGARDRRVVICIQGIIAMAMATISPDLIEVIKEPKKK